MGTPSPEVTGNFAEFLSVIDSKFELDPKEYQIVVAAMIFWMA